MRGAFGNISGQIRVILVLVGILGFTTFFTHMAIGWRRNSHQPWSVQAGARLRADHLFALESTGSTVSCHILTNYVFQYLRFFKGSRVSWHIWLNMYFQPRPDAKKLFFWECREHKCVEKLKMSELGILTSVQKKSVPRCVWGISTDLAKRIQWFVSG